MEERQKRRRRSIRNIRRRSEIVPFEPLEVEESKTEEKKCDTDGGHEDVYGSLWMETKEPVVKKKKRRSSLFNFKSQQSNGVESASLWNSGHQPDYDTETTNLSNLNTQPSDYTNCSSLFNFKSQRNDGTKEDCKHTKHVDDRDSKQWNYTDSKILRKESLGESIGEKETLSNTFSTEMSNGSLVNQDVQNSQIVVPEKENDIESFKSPDCRDDHVTSANSVSDDLSVGTPTNVMGKKLAQNAISSDDPKSHSYLDGECILTPPDSANKSTNEHDVGYSGHTDYGDVVNTPPNLTIEKSRLPSMSPEFPASAVSPECNGNGRISVDSDCNSSLTSPSETSENSFRSTSMSPEYPETPAEKKRNSGKESYLSSLNDVNTEDLQMNKENSFNMNNSNTMDKVSPECKLGTKVKDKADVQKETNTDNTSPSYFSITKAIGKVVEFVKTSPSYIFGFDTTGKATDELSASPVLKSLQTDNIAAFEQKPGNCSLKEAAVTRFSLKSDDILPSPDTCRIVGVGLNDGQNTRKINKDTALKSPAKDIFTDTFNAVLKAFETPNEKKSDAASKSSKKEVREKPVFPINQINKETVPSLVPTNDNLSEHSGHSVDNACKNNEQSDDSSAVSFSTCTTLVEESKQKSEEKCVEINNIQNCEEKCEETIETKSYLDHEELGDTVTEQNMEAGPTEVNTEIDVPDRVCPEADSEKSLPQINQSDFNIINNDCSKILTDVNETVKEETSTDKESEKVKSKRGRPRKKGRRSVDKTISQPLEEAEGSSHELNINLPIDTEQTDDTAESKTKVGRRKGRRSGNIEAFRNDIEMFRDRELIESDAKQETNTGDVQTDSNTEDQSQAKTSRRVRRRSAEVAALMIHQQNESSEKETNSEDIQTAPNTVDQSEGKTSRRKGRRSAEVAAAIIEEVNESCDKEVKVKGEKQSRKRKAESDDAEIEKIYRNKNYVKPEEHKPWQTIHESPDRFGDIIGKKRMQRFINFDKPTQMKLRRRSQKASKLGWNPASKKHVFLDDDVVQEKLDKLWADLDGSCPESPSLESALKAIVDTD